LRQVHRRDRRIDTAPGHFVEGLRQGGVQFTDELTAADGGRVGGAFATDQDDAGGQGVGFSANHSTIKLRSHRPGAGEGKAGADHRVEKGFPAGTGGAGLALGLRLLEGVVDRHRKGRMRLVGQILDGAGHAIEEEGFGLILTIVPVRCSDQFLGLGDGYGGIKTGEDRFQTLA